MKQVTVVCTKTTGGAFEVGGKYQASFLHGVWNVRGTDKQLYPVSNAMWGNLGYVSPGREVKHVFTIFDK